ncbi:MAG: CPBP family intramembrane metalloprotease [Defluviitaleaceae bacterium]|nr:CPBP family intramembrane metalloprotease [Defluviitaleaceae bacterium]
MTVQRTLTPTKIGIYLIIFFAVWSIRELVIQPLFLTPLDDIADAIIGQAIKLLVWTLPAVLLIKHYQHDMRISLRDMFTTKPKWFSDAYILLAVFTPLFSSLLTHGEVAVSPTFDPIRLIGAVVFVGITEEMVFRGFLLNTFLKRMELKRSVALNEILFVLIHYPIWIYRGLDLTAILTNSIGVFFIGAFFSYSFIKTGNIIVPIALHMIWNLLVILFGA